MNTPFKRLWSKLPNRASFEMPVYFGKTPRLDPVRAIAEHCASQELKLYSKTDIRKNGKNAEVIAEHEFYELLENPVPNYTEIDGWTLKYFTFCQLELVGECAWIKVREGSKIVALLPVLKSWIIAKPTIENRYYKILPYGEVGNTTVIVPVEDVILFKDIDMSDPYGNGLGLAESIADEIETDEFASKYQKNFFYNDATPPFVITGFQGGEAQADKVKKTFMEKLGGYFHAREPAVLTGSADVKTLGINPKELDMVASRKYLRDECLHHFRLPPEVMGIIENSNRSTIDASFYLMQKNVMLPRLARFERVLNRQLLPDFDKDLICKHDFEIDEDIDQKLRIYQVGIDKGIITREEFRKAFGFNPEIKEGTIILPMGLNIVEAGEEINIDEIPEEDEIEIEDEEENGKGLAFDLIKKKDDKEKVKFKVWQMFDQKAKNGESYFISSVKKIAKRQNEDFNDLINNYKGEPIVNVISNYFDKEVDKKVKSTLASAWLNSMRSGRELAKTVLSEKSVQSLDDVIVTNEAFNKWIESYGLEKSVLLNDTTKKQLVKKFQQILAESETTEESMPILKKKLQEGAKEVFDELSNVRAYLIARTETGASVNIGQVATYKAYNVGRKEWVPTFDDRTRESHLNMAGVVIGIDESFEVEKAEGGVDNMLYPLDPTGSAGNVCNCRCTILPIID
ncbi:MAG: phage portal protein [Treponema sp.]|nr:phage portal protein [Treponema sp.]